MKTSLLIGSVLVLVGASLLIYAFSLPVYTDDTAPSRLSMSLQDSPREERFREWYSQLREFETGHKTISDGARGIIALGVAIVLSTALLLLYRSNAKYQKLRFIIILWLGLWAIRVPLSFWYYGIRQSRFDYPSWGDSIAIPIFSEVFVWIIGALVTTVVLFCLTFRQVLPTDVKWNPPLTANRWIRACFLGIWILLLAFLVVVSIPEGNEGMIISCGVASAILWIILNAKKRVEQCDPPNGYPRHASC